MDSHCQALSVLCRVCGNLSDKKTFRVTSYKSELKKAFNLNVDLDEKGFHPQYFCNKCYMKSRHLTKGTAYSHIAKMRFFKWEKCSLECGVCKKYNSTKKVGRRQKVKHARGRPTANPLFWCRTNTQFFSLVADDQQPIHYSGAVLIRKTCLI